MGAVLVEIIPIFVEILKAAPTVVKEVEAAWKLLTDHTPATADQQATIDAALEEAHAAVQASP